MVMTEVALFARHPLSFCWCAVEGIELKRKGGKIEIGNHNFEIKK
jgi:hypothetical protein